MKMRKSDFSLVKEAEEAGMLVSMTNVVSAKRTELNNSLNHHFRKQIPTYNGNFDEYEGEEVLSNINKYRRENNINHYHLAFPVSEGTDIHLIPIGSNIHLQLIVADEYYGGGEYEKYVRVDSFIISESATEEDVDHLIQFTKEYLLPALHK